jgi:hypothetical protein
MRSGVGQTLCSGKGALNRIASEQSTASIVDADDVSYGCIGESERQTTAIQRF